MSGGCDGYRHGSPAKPRRSDGPTDSRIRGCRSEQRLRHTVIGRGRPVGAAAFWEFSCFCPSDASGSHQGIRTVPRYVPSTVSPAITGLKKHKGDTTDGPGHVLARSSLHRQTSAAGDCAGFVLAWGNVESLLMLPARSVGSRSAPLRSAANLSRTQKSLVNPLIRNRVRCIPVPMRRFVLKR